MSFRSIARDIRDSIGSLSRRHNHGKSNSALHVLCDHPEVNQSSCWASLPPELPCDVIKRLEKSGSTWPAPKDIVVCAAVCRSWREMCKEIFQSPELSGKLTFPVSLKQPGPRDGTIQCFVKRDNSNSTYHLFLCLNPALFSENGKFLLSAKRNRRATCTDYVISMHADNTSGLRSSYVGKLRSNFLGTKFTIYDARPPYNYNNSLPARTSRSYYSKIVSPRVPTLSYNTAQITYKLNVLGTRSPCRMHCVMHSIPASSLEPGCTVPGQPELRSCPLEDSFKSISFSSARFSEENPGDVKEGNDRPLVLKNKSPRWHEQLQCWCLNFQGRVTIASVKNFELVAVSQPSASAPIPSQAASSDHMTKSSCSLVNLAKICLQWIINILYLHFRRLLYV